MAASDGMKRRDFLGGVMGWTAAGVALIAGAGCENALTPDDTLGMHGPVRLDEKYFVLPRARSAEALFTPYDTGQIFASRWAIAYLGRGHQDQLIAVVIDADTGGHAELEIFAADPGIHPLARTSRYHLHLNDGGRGDKKTPRHLERLAQSLADIIAKNEEEVRLGWRLASHREAQARGFARQ